MKLYGSLNNRFEENKMYVDKIEVGTLATEYHWSDRTPYEVVEVEDQKHVFIRELKAKRIDNNGMSDSQSYEYSSDETKPIKELQLRNGKWYKVNRMSKEKFLKRAESLRNDFKDRSIEKAYNYCIAMSGLTQKQIERIEQGKEVKRFSGIDISFGKAEKYFDYSF